MKPVKEIFNKPVDSLDVCYEAYIAMSDAIKRGGIVEAQTTINGGQTHQEEILESRNVYYVYRYLMENFRKRLKLRVLEQAR